MRRLPRISVRVGAAVAGVALCVAVTVLAATGTLTGGAKHAGPSAAQRALREARIAALKAAVTARLRAENTRPEPRPRIPRGNPSARYSGAVRIAMRSLGVPYVWGGASPRAGFDSSGLVQYVYGKLGVSLPHYTVSQFNYPHAVRPSRSKLKPGDLVFFDGLGQVGIYIGDNQFIHAPHTGAVVRIDSITGRYAREYDGASRILG